MLSRETGARCGRFREPKRGVKHRAAEEQRAGSGPGAGLSGSGEARGLGLRPAGSQLRQLLQPFLQLQRELLVAPLTHGLHVELHKLVPGEARQWSGGMGSPLGPSLEHTASHTAACCPGRDFVARGHGRPLEVGDAR